MRRFALASLPSMVALAFTAPAVPAFAQSTGLNAINNVVIIYAENRSFDNLFGHYPGANGLNTAAAKAIKQVNRDGSTLPVLPPSWNGLTAAGQTPAVTQLQTTNVWPNAPFQIDAPTDQYGYGTLPNSIITRDLYHRFFENQMQVDAGKNDMFAAWGDSGGTVMGNFDGSKTQLWNIARQYTVADNFFEAAWGGSFLNHQYLICACAPTVAAATVAANKMTVAVLDTPSAAGVPQLKLASTSPASALVGKPVFTLSGNIVPLDYFGSGDGYRAVNTMQPAYQPSGNAPKDNSGPDPLYANPTAATTLPPQTQTTIGDLLTSASIGWTWYSGGWANASANPYPWNGTSYGTSKTIYNTNSNGTADANNTDFQSHHQPFNYYAAFDPVTNPAGRAIHLRDRGDLYSDAANGTLPAVSFYKPVGYQNQHPGYANVTDADTEIVSTIAALQASPQWANMIIIVTYDEFGGQFDHVAPPTGDKLGPGTRIPAIIISPFAKKGFVDHTMYDTASTLRLITKRWNLPVLPGLATRDAAVTASTGKPMGDLTNALILPH